jgi:hypothetical protein
MAARVLSTEVDRQGLMAKAETISGVALKLAEAANKAMEQAAQPQPSAPPSTSPPPPVEPASPPIHTHLFPSFPTPLPTAAPTAALTPGPGPRPVHREFVVYDVNADNSLSLPELIVSLEDHAMQFMPTLRRVVWHNDSEPLSAARVREEVRIVENETATERWDWNRRLTETPDKKDERINWMKFCVRMAAERIAPALMKVAASRAALRLGVAGA